MAVAFAGLFLVGCEKPKLRTAESSEPAEEDSALPEKGMREFFLHLRKSVIGQTFSNLTLGSRQFSGAEVVEITDEAILLVHSGGSTTIPWREVPKEVKERWGFDPSAVTEEPVSVAESPTHRTDPPKTVATPEEPKPPVDLRQQAQAIAQAEAMAEAQLAGVRSLESDLARHSAVLTDLKARLRNSLARQANQKKGGIMVERIGGQSTIVDHAAEARDLEAKVAAEQAIVTQLSKSLQSAKARYGTLLAEISRLRNG